MKELRIVMDDTTHKALKDKAKNQRRSIKNVIETLIDDYLNDRLAMTIREDMKSVDHLVTQVQNLKKLLKLQKENV